MLNGSTQEGKGIIRQITIDKPEALDLVLGQDHYQAGDDVNLLYGHFEALEADMLDEVASRHKVLQDHELLFAIQHFLFDFEKFQIAVAALHHKIEIVPHDFHFELLTDEAHLLVAIGQLDGLG